MSIHWKRIKNISKAKYESCFSAGSSPKQTALNIKIEKAYEQAAKIREFEIGLYWKRAGYFWAFIVSIYTAFFSVQKEFYYIKESRQLFHGELPLLVLASLGFFFCIAWVLSSYASKHWQENWEKHLDLLEDYVTGPLYKTYSANRSYSVSKINIVAGWIISFCSAGLLIFEMIEFCKKLNSFLKFLFFVMLFVLSVCGIIALLMNTKGNASDFGEIEFDCKVYEV